MEYPVDLHIHSYYSDGVDSLETILEKASHRGLQAIAITDHDVFCQIDQYPALSERYHIDIIPGLEVSCVDASNGRKVHILAYGLTKDRAPHLKPLLDQFLDHAQAMRQQMIEDINLRLGPVLSYAAIKEEFPHSILYKQQIAIHLSRYLETPYQEVYQRYFRGPGSLDERYPVRFNDVYTVIQAILADGGIPVLAHPRTYRSMERIETYIHWGLKGIECSHPSYRPGDLQIVLPYIEKYHLLKTGGSDYHGALSLSNQRQLAKFGVEIPDYLHLKEELSHDVSD